LNDAIDHNRTDFRSDWNGQYPFAESFLGTELTAATCPDRKRIKPEHRVSGSGGRKQCIEFGNVSYAGPVEELAQAASAT
jgi:hypothetical protein